MISRDTGCRILKNNHKFRVGIAINVPNMNIIISFIKTSMSFNDFSIMFNNFAVNEGRKKPFEEQHYRMFLSLPKNERIAKFNHVISIWNMYG